MVEIFDVMGKRKMSARVQISSSKGTLNINGIQKGVYMLKAIDSYGNAKTTRFVIQ
jgi:ribosomal protein S9